MTGYTETDPLQSAAKGELLVLLSAILIRLPVQLLREEPFEDSGLHQASAAKRRSP